jgi:hypothetical protein
MLLLFQEMRRYEGGSIQTHPGSITYLLSALQVTARIQTCVPLSHQTLDAFLEEFRKLLLDKVANSSFHLSVRLASASVECLLQWPKDVEVARGKIRTVRWTLQCLQSHVLHLRLDGVRYARACVIVQVDDRCV